MRLKHELRRFSHRFGVDVVRYPLRDPLARTVNLMRHHGVNCVLDVGANDGGFGKGIRDLGYTGRIVSFEPLRKPFQSLSAKASSDGNWEVRNCAIGDTSTEVTINVSGNDGLSSSVLPILAAHTKAEPSSQYVGSETANQERLDALFPTLGVHPDATTFLKVDVQGYEEAVLDGASALFADGGIIGLQLELSLIPLYDGAMPYRRGLDFAENLGLVLMGLDPVFADSKTGQLLQVDAVFFGTAPGQCIDGAGSLRPR